MMMLSQDSFLIFSTLFLLCCGQETTLKPPSSSPPPPPEMVTPGSEFHEIFRFQEKSADNAYHLDVQSLGRTALSGQLGIALPAAVGHATHLTSSFLTTTGDPDNAVGQFHECFKYGDYARLCVTSPNATNGYCGTILWNSSYARRLEDCYDIQDGVHWYGGGTPTYIETWPIETMSRPEAPMVSEDILNDGIYGGVTENYWLLSNGIAIHVDEDVPLFVSINSTTNPNKICFIAQDKKPYQQRAEIRLSYQICTGRDKLDDLKTVHQRAHAQFYAKPKAIPSKKMIVHPFWSTWAKYGIDVNQTLVQDYARQLKHHGLLQSNQSHIEIDDRWERCYGDHTFDAHKFPNVTEMVQSLNVLGLGVTLWMHPFINIECTSSFTEASELGFLIWDEKGTTALVKWWDGDMAGLIDFSNPSAVLWWSKRLKSLKKKYHIDSFKFDAGETNLLPPSYNFSTIITPQNAPNAATHQYSKMAATFGRMVEVRVAHQSQNEPIFVRMMDKHSRWGNDNGLGSLIPTLLSYGLHGYPFVIPDMVGGNANDDESPSKELYIRWVQANCFMPAMQFSIPPWDFDEETVDIVKEIVSLREKFADSFVEAAMEAVKDGSPMNRPLWWSETEPMDPKTLTIHTEFMLGDDILVAPVLTQGQTSRDIYLPRGRWSISVGSKVDTYTGPMTLKDFPAPLNVLPYFVREKSKSLKNHQKQKNDSESLNFIK